MVNEVYLGIEEHPKMVRVGTDVEERSEKNLIKLLRRYISLMHIVSPSLSPRLLLTLTVIKT